MKISLLDSYIIKEVIYPFLIGIGIVTVIMLSSLLFQMTDLIIVKEVPTLLVLKLLFYQLPEVVVQTFPIAILFATMTGIGRLNRENEIVALRMGGISLYRLILPLLIAGIIISGLTYVINEEIVPWSNHKARNIIRKTILKEAMPDVKEAVFFTGPKGRLFYVQNYDEKNKTIKKVVIFNNKKKEEFPEIITAKSGRIVENFWHLNNGIIHNYDEDGHLVLESRFDLMEVELAKDNSRFFGEQRTPSEMSREELKKEIDLFRSSGIEVNSLLVDYHLKLAMPLTAFLFILLGTPLSLANNKSRTVGVVFTIVIIFLYYLIMSISRSFGRNGILPPLFAAWLPDIIFALLGIALLFWRESWQMIFRKIINIFAIVSLLIIFSIPVGAEKINIKGDHLDYDSENGFVKISGNIDGKYRQFFFQAEEVRVIPDEKEDSLLDRPSEINLFPGKFTGCDYEKPHYYFQAQKLNIYPGDYLEAYHVVLRELNGSLPLFYWPYLYISLREDEQQLVPEFGYSERRGWFLKATYYYRYKDYPGELYFDLYELTGIAGGFKQYYIYREKEKGFLKLFSQENKIDLPGLFKWQGETAYEKSGEPWNTRSDFKYSYYDDYYYLSGSAAFNSRSFKLDSRLNIRDYHLHDLNDRREIAINMEYDKRFKNNLDLEIQYEKELELEPDEGFTDNNFYEFMSKYGWGKDWNVFLRYKYEDLIEPDEELKKRWGGKTYLQKGIADFDLQLLWERYDPVFSAEDEVSFYRSPEFNIEYKPAGHFSYLYSSGRYYEDKSEFEGNRTKAAVKYKNRWNLHPLLQLDTEEDLWGIYYEKSDNTDFISRQYVYKSRWGLINDFTEQLRLDSNYKVTIFKGESIFNFDQEKYEEIIESKLRYDLDRLRLSLNGGYDVYNKEYLPLRAVVRLYPVEEWKIEMGTSYDLNEQEFSKDFYLSSRYNSERLKVDTAIRYDLNERQLIDLDNKLVYELKGEWGWYLETNQRYDFEKEDKLEEANILFRKELHCRSITFKYDYLNEEYSVQYQIDLFPSAGVKVGKSKEDDFIFETGIEELLNEED